MKKKVETINLAPTPSAYANLLISIIKSGTNPDSVTWAEQEIVNAFLVAAQNNPDAWSGVKLPTKLTPQRILDMFDTAASFALMADNASSLQEYEHIIEEIRKEIGEIPVDKPRESNACKWEFELRYTFSTAEEIGDMIISAIDHFYPDQAGAITFTQVKEWLASKGIADK